MNIYNLRQRLLFCDFEVRECRIDGLPIILRIEEYHSPGKTYVYYHSVAFLDGTLREKAQSLFCFNFDRDHAALHEYCIKSLYYTDNVNFEERYKELGGIEITN